MARPAKAVNTKTGTITKEEESIRKETESRLKGSCNRLNPPKYLTDDQYYRLKDHLEQFPKDDHVVHGDFHIKNIMQQNGENLLIDMDTLSMGHPVFELAGIYAAYIGFSCVDKNNASEFFGIKREQADDIWKYTV